MSKWTTTDMPSQHGRTAVVTGANSGLGRVVATELARAGASVVLACRDVGKGERAAADMPGDVEVRALDLADLGSVREFATSIDTDVDLLVNNAGLMAIPEKRTAQGFEMQFGVNHLGHFALTGLLLDRITDRVVALSSFVHRMGAIRLSDPNFTRGYRRWAAYGQSKLANLMFAFELQRRLTEAGSAVRAMAAHPGYAATNLQGRTESILDVPTAVANRFVAQSAYKGALPTLYAATVPDLPGGSYIGPDQPGEFWGHPRRVGCSAAAHNRTRQRELWRLSAELTGVDYDFEALVR